MHIARHRGLATERGIDFSELITCAEEVLRAGVQRRGE